MSDMPNYLCQSHLLLVGIDIRATGCAGLSRRPAAHHQMLAGVVNDMVILNTAMTEL